jgi:hypothetical protein
MLERGKGRRSKKENKVKREVRRERREGKGRKNNRMIRSL